MGFTFVHSECGVGQRIFDLRTHIEAKKDFGETARLMTINIVELPFAKCEK